MNDRILKAFGQNKDKYRLALIVIAFLVFSVVTFFVSKQVTIGTSDPALYALVAENLVKGNGFALDAIVQHIVPFDSITHPLEYDFEGMSILYAPIVWLFGKNVLALKIPGLVIGIILFPILVYHLGKEFFSKRIGFLAGVTMLFYPTIFPLSFLGERDEIFAFFLVAGLYFFYMGMKYEKPKYYYIMGAILGFSYLIRPATMIAFPTVLLSYYFVKKTISKQLVYGLAISGIIMSPWLVRNFLIFGDPFFTLNKYMGWTVGYVSYVEDAFFRLHWDNAVKPGPEFLLNLPGERSIQSIFAWRTLTNLGVQFYKYFPLNLLAFIGIILMHKKGETKKLKIPAIGLIAFIAVAALLWLYGGMTIDQRMLARTAAQVSPYIFLLLAFFFVYRKDSMANTLFAVFLAGSAIFYSFIWVSDPRYWLPVIPFLVIYAWAGIEKIIWSFVTRAKGLKISEKKLQLLLLAMLALFVAVSIPFTFAKFVSEKAEFPYQDDNHTLGKIQVAERIAEITAPDDVIMGCDVVFAQFYNGRKYVEFPSGRFDDAMKVMQKYNVSYLTLQSCHRRGIDKFLYATITGEKNLYKNTTLEDTITVLVEDFETGEVDKIALPYRYTNYIYKVNITPLEKDELNQTRYNLNLERI